jgi:hypothetical protein
MLRNTFIILRTVKIKESTVIRFYRTSRPPASSLPCRALNTATDTSSPGRWASTYVTNRLCTAYNRHRNQTINRKGAYILAAQTSHNIDAHWVLSIDISPLDPTCLYQLMFTPGGTSVCLQRLPQPPVV